MALIWVLDGSTKTSCLQFSQAIGPRKLMSDGSFKCLMPDPQRLPSGFPLVTDDTGGSLALLTTWANLTCDRAKQLSKVHTQVWQFG